MPRPEYANSTKLVRPMMTVPAFFNRSTTLDGLTDGYTAADDLKSLVEPISGASLTGMRERAALYGGRVEATRVPGVGFTVSAIFPNLRELAGV